MAIKTTAIVNLKGGVAKSTTVINMASILAKKHGKKVFIIDGDSQCNTTEFFGADPDKGNLATVLRNSGEEPDPGKVDKMTFRQEPLLISSPKSSAGKDYRKFVEEFVGGK